VIPKAFFAELWQNILALLGFANFYWGWIPLYSVYFHSTSFNLEIISQKNVDELHR
jgi:hypothetical protein